MKFLNYIYIIACLLIGFACSDFLEEYSQDTYYVSSYRDLDELLIGDCYCPVQSTSPISGASNLGAFIHFLGDEMEEQNGYFSTDFDNKEKIFGYYTWQQRVGTKDSYTGFFSENVTWTESYRLINVANNIISSVKKVPQNSLDEKTGAIRVNGEAHFLRGAYYFWLVNLYGKPYNPQTSSSDLGVPIKIENKVNDKVYQRNTVQEVYAQVLSDLQQAERNLSQTGKAKSIYRADSTAVHLLMSRVYLYMQNWKMAIRYADKVLKVRPDLIDLNHLTGAPLTKNSVENIFSMGGNDIPCFLCNNFQSFRVSKELYGTYDADDLRKEKFWWTYEDFVGYTKVSEGTMSTYTRDNAGYYYYQYNIGLQGYKSTISDKFLFRSSEAYLNKAEAAVYLGNEDDARSALNTLRRNRYKDGVSYEVNTTGTDLIKAIREERRKELALEGHRWFDLRRYSSCEKYPESKRIVHNYTYYEGRGSNTMKERHQFILEENDLAYTLPIPQSILNFNTGMKNNERPERNYTIIPID